MISRNYFRCNYITNNFNYSVVKMSDYSHFSCLNEKRKKKKDNTPKRQDTHFRHRLQNIFLVSKIYLTTFLLIFEGSKETLLAHW